MIRRALLLDSRRQFFGIALLSVMAMLSFAPSLSARDGDDDDSGKTYSH